MIRTVVYPPDYAGRVTIEVWQRCGGVWTLVRCVSRCETATEIEDAARHE